IFFFFSSRRRHTSLTCDWSSDVCSSDLVPDRGLPGIRIEAHVRCEGKTGAEMEALTAVATAALTVVDMAKSVDRWMTIDDVTLVLKRGGKSGAVRRPG